MCVPAFESTSAQYRHAIYRPGRFFFAYNNTIHSVTACIHALAFWPIDSDATQPRARAEYSLRTDTPVQTNTTAGDLDYTVPLTLLAYIGKHCLLFLRGSECVDTIDTHTTIGVGGRVDG